MSDEIAVQDALRAEEELNLCATLMVAASEADGDLPLDEVDQLLNVGTGSRPST